MIPVSRQEVSTVAIRKRFGRYRVDRELGRGGMGVVYAAYDDQLERLVAIKTIGEAAADEKARKRLRREARAAARIQHPNVCHLYEIVEDNGEGGGAALDRVSLMFANLGPGGAAEVCDGSLGGALLPTLGDIDKGNVQVH